MKIANPKPLLKDLITVRDIVMATYNNPVWLLGAAGLLETMAQEIRKEVLMRHPDLELLETAKS